MFKEDIIERFYKIFENVGEETVEKISNISINQFMKPNSGKPFKDILSIRNGNIKNLLLQKVMVKRTGEQIEASKSIDGKISNIHEKGFSYIPTREQWKKLFGALRRLGWYEENYVNPLGQKGKIVFPPRKFVQPAIDKMTSTEIKEIVIRKVKNEFKDKKVIVVG